MVPSNTTATPAVTIDSRVSAARSNSLSSGFRTSESKNNVDLVDNLDRGRRYVSQSTFLCSLTSFKFQLNFFCYAKYDVEI